MDETNFAEARDALVDRLGRREALDEEVIEAMRSVPREAFVPESQRERAYADRPLPIGEGQTISAPHMVAIMANELDLDPGERTLEIGTGCGYHAAVTAEIAGAECVYSVEYHETLARDARHTLARLGYDDISIRIGDGHRGWPENAPYDAVYFTCAADSFPTQVVEQVRVGGRLLAPIGTGSQWLVYAEKQPDGSLSRDRLTRVRFVQMQGPA